ncbi:MAG: HEPN domain-containing protein [Chloroflexota bacterium]|nr:MAG: hypothetical protein DLM70_12395 [Chloroflexota bacterium]
MLKAAIVYGGAAPPRVHGIMELLTHLDHSLQEELQHFATGLQDLDRYYAPTRYPDAAVGGLAGEEEAGEALAVARSVATIIDDAVR